MVATALCLSLLLTAPEPTPAAERLLPADTSWTVQFGVGLAAGMVATPASLFLAQWVGSLSTSLIGAAIPALLVMGLLPPLITTLACWLTGNWDHPGRYRFWPAFGVNVLINAAAMVAAGYAGASNGAFGSVAFFGVVNGGLMSGAATLMMRALAPSLPAATVTF